MAQTLTKSRMQEAVKCGKNPQYFINKYCRVQHPKKGIIPFDTYDFQDDCIDDFVNHRYNIVLKARQLGLSTVTAAFSLWLALFHKGRSVLVIATKKSTAQNFFKKVKVMLTHVPMWLRLSPVVKNNQSELEFASGSSIKAISTSDDAGRSESLSLLIIDEAAFIKNFDDLWTGLQPTLSHGGRCIILSTPNGVGNMFHRLYTDADAGLNDFKPTRLPWMVHPEHDEEWFASECKRLGSKRRIAQEHLCDFVTSGETFLDVEHIEWIGSHITPPIAREGDDKNIWIWRPPISGQKYIISADVARGDGKDFSTFHIIDVGESECVAEYKGKMPPDELGQCLCTYGLRYNNALVCPENNTFGYATCIKLRELNYPKLYYANSKAVYITGYVPSQTDKIPGFATSGPSRIKILAKLEEIIRNRGVRIYSSRFYDELKTFIWATQKPQAAKGYNDDLIMSMAIGVWLYDASAGYSRYSESLAENMLKGMSVRESTIDDIPNTGRDVRITNPFTPPDAIFKRHEMKQLPKDNRVSGEINLHPHQIYKWLL